MARLAADGSLARSKILDDYFEFGLQRVLDGLERYIEDRQGGV